MSVASLIKDLDRAIEERSQGASLCSIAQTILDDIYESRLVFIHSRVLDCEIGIVWRELEREVAVKQYPDYPIFTLDEFCYVGKLNATAELLQQLVLANRYLKTRLKSAIIKR